MEGTMMLVASKDGNFGFVGLDCGSDDKMVRLDKPLTLTYDNDGNVRLTLGHAPLGIVDPLKPFGTVIPMDNVAYCVNIKSGSEHPLEKMYEDFFVRAEHLDDPMEEAYTPE